MARFQSFNATQILCVAAFSLCGAVSLLCSAVVCYVYVCVCVGGGGGGGKGVCT